MIALATHTHRFNSIDKIAGCPSREIPRAAPRAGSFTKPEIFILQSTIDNDQKETIMWRMLREIFVVDGANDNNDEAAGRRSISLRA